MVPRAAPWTHHSAPCYRPLSLQEGQMRWRYAGMSVLSLMVMTGCPTEFGKDGRVSRAAHQDSLELVRKHCSEERRNELCGGGREHSPECLDECGG